MRATLLLVPLTHHYGLGVPICRCEVQCCLPTVVDRVDLRPLADEFLQTTVLSSQPPKAPTEGLTVIVSVRPLAAATRRVVCLWALKLSIGAPAPISSFASCHPSVGESAERVSVGRTFMASICPFAAARCNAVCPSSSMASIFTPFSKSTFEEPPMTQIPRHERRHNEPPSSLCVRVLPRGEAPSDHEH